MGGEVYKTIITVQGKEYARVFDGEYSCAGCAFIDDDQLCKEGRWAMPVPKICGEYVFEELKNNTVKEIKMRKIAIITTGNSYDDHYDDYDVIVESITDWSEVSEEDYHTLMLASRNTSAFQVIQRLDADPNFIPKTIADYLQKSKEEAEKKRRAEQSAKAKKDAAALKKKAKTEADELALLRQLQEKHKDKVNLPTQI